MVDECTSRNQRGCQWAVSVCDGEQRFFLFPLSMARRRKLFNIISLLPSTIPHRSTGKQRGMGATAELDDLIFCWNESGPPWSVIWSSSLCLEMCLAQQWVRLGRVHHTINKFIASAMAWTPASRLFMRLAQHRVWLSQVHLVFHPENIVASKFVTDSKNHIDLQRQWRLPMSSERLRTRTTILFISTLHGQAQRTLHEFLYHFQSGNSVAWEPQGKFYLTEFLYHFQSVRIGNNRKEATAPSAAIVNSILFISNWRAKPCA